MKTVWIFGDSISAEVPKDAESHQQGWAFFLKERLNDQIEYKNVAKAGSTLKTFYNCEDYRKGKIHKNAKEDSRWYEILSEVKEGDLFVLFVGGVNDHGQIGEDAYYPCPDGDYIIDDYFEFFKNEYVYMYVGKGYGTHRFYTARSSVEDFIKLLGEMIEQLKEKGAIPLLARGTGKYYKRNNDEFDVFPSNHEYMEALPALAQKLGIVYLDVGGIMEEGFKTKGYTYMMENYFMSISAVERLNKEYGKNQKTNYNDNCHYNIDGAKHLCDIFVDELKKTDYELNKYLK